MNYSIEIEKILEDHNIPTNEIRKGNGVIRVKEDLLSEDCWNDLYDVLQDGNSISDITTEGSDGDVIIVPNTRPKRINNIIGGETPINLDELG